MLAAYLKWQPVCAHFSALADALDALKATALRERGVGLAREGVAAVEVSLYAAALVYDAGVPADELASRFSPAAIVYASLEPAGLRGPALADAASGRPEVRDWLARVRVRHDPSLDAGYPAGRPARVVLRTVDGRELRAAADAPYGDATHPMSASDRRGKALAALASALGDAAAPRAIEAFAAWVGGDGAARSLGAALRPGPPRDR